MSIDTKQLVENVIRPALQAAGLHSLAAEQLLAGTCAAESDMGSFIKQKGGPALGIYQMEPDTHRDIYLNYLNHRTAKKRTILAACDYSPTVIYSDDRLIHDLRYATLMARVKYLRDSNALPAYNDTHAQAEYWKRVYNTAGGKGTIDKYLEKFDKYLRKYYFGYEFEQ